MKAVDAELPDNANYRLSKRDITFISDKEFNGHYLFANTAEVMEDRQRVIRNAPCWNHLTDNVKRKFHELKFEKAEETRAASHFRYLLQSESEEEYLIRREEMFDADVAMSPWQSKEAKDYFDKHLDEVCQKEACSFRLREAGIANA